MRNVGAYKPWKKAVNKCLIYIVTLVFDTKQFIEFLVLLFAKFYFLGNYFAYL